MQLGFCSAILPDLDFEQTFQFAKSIGYDCVEVMCWPPSKADRRYAGITHIDCTSFGPREVERVQKVVSDTGVAISALGYYPNALSGKPEEAAAAVEHIRKVIVAAEMLGLDRMTTFLGRDWTKSVDDNWPRFLATWRPIIQFAADHGVRIGIENCPMIFSADEWPGGKNLGSSPVIWRRMFSDIPEENFGLNYDPSHMVWLHMDYLRPLKEFASRIFHVHAKDVRVDRDKLNDYGIMAHPDRWHTPKLPGLGDVHWGQFFSQLTDSGYQGPVCVEVEDRSYEGALERRKASLIQSHTYLRNFIPRVAG